MFWKKITAVSSTLLFVPLFALAANSAAASAQKPSIQTVLSVNTRVRNDASTLKDELQTKTPSNSEVMSHIQALQQDTNKLSSDIADFAANETSLTAKQKQDLSRMKLVATIMSTLMKDETNWAHQGIEKNRKLLRAYAVGLEKRSGMIEKDASRMNL